VRAVIVQELRIYPLKSARGISLAHARVDHTGLQWDRHWLAIRADGTFLTQRTHPALARIATALGARGLCLRTEGQQPLDLPFDGPGLGREVRIWRDTCEAADLGDAAAAWISTAVGEPARLVRSLPTPSRRADARFAGPRPVPLAFPDGYPVLVCNQASLDALNRRLPEALPIERFRPNVVLRGLEPFAEDRIDCIQIGSVRLRLVKPCTRCIIPSIDPRTGLRGVDPLPVLRTFRFDPALRGSTFGENAIIEAGFGARIERGAPCEVTEENTKS
jgi:hypothetical protein